MTLLSRPSILTAHSCDLAGQGSRGYPWIEVRSNYQLCALGRKIEGPSFDGKALVTSDGFVMCNFTDSYGQYHMGAFVGDISDLDRNVAGLSAHVKLNETDRAA
jgi:hypothetical protein